MFGSNIIFMVYNLTVYTLCLSRTMIAQSV